MNIAVFADVHGRILLCFKLCQRWELETGEHIDYILQAGDLGAYPDIERLDRATIKHIRNDPSELGFAADFVDYHADIAAELSKTTCPLIFVRGNHEDHEWLNELERASSSSEPIFSIDAYQRIFCLKTGIPYSLQSKTSALTVVGIGRIGSPVGEKQPKSKYIQPNEQERLYELDNFPLDVLLTHDTARDFVTKGYGMEEIRLVLDAYEPLYHFHGHTEEPYTKRLDTNGRTLSYKLADLHFGSKTKPHLLEPAAMGILRWENRAEHSFEVISDSWLNEYTAKSWRFVER